MWALLLPLPWFFLGLFAARVRRRGQRGCFILVGVFGWPQAQLLQKLGVGSVAAWAISLGLMIIFPIIGYLLGMRLSGDDDEPPHEDQ